MSSNYTRLFRVLFVIILLKLCFLVILYWRSYEGVSSLEAGLAQSQSQTRRMVDIFDQLLVDRREMPSMEQRLRWIRQEMPSFPLEELLQRQRLPASRVDCGPAPDLMNIDFHNTYWQRALAENLTYYIFGAYYDDRETVPEAPLVRLLTMINQPEDKSFKYPATHCQFWLEGRAKPLIAPVTEHKVMWLFGSAPRRYYPTLMGCRMPKGRHQWEVPQMVSLVADACDRARNLLRVVYEVESQAENGTAATNATEQEAAIEKRPLRFAVCVKAMDFPYEDKSWRLIEWLELMRSLGAHKVVFYNAQMHPNMTRVLRDYVAESPGFVELRPMSLGRGEPHAPRHFHHYAMEADGFNRILNEMIPYNDCFYRNMYRYDYIGVFDTDEVIMPLGNRTTWSELIEISRAAPDYGGVTPATCKEWVSFCYRNVYYPRYPERPKVYRNLSSSFYMLQHVERVREHCNRAAATKCLHDTRFAVGLHNHFTFYHTEKASCPAKSVPIEFAQMQHYREPDTKSLLIDPIIDASIWRFQPQLQAQVEQRYRRLGFLPDERQVAATHERQRLEDESMLREAMRQNSP
ncbi:uncharacterized protein LOC117590688 [Drosophila guanche]|uniref:Glycosyltransferase family 92 protein n=1 Tax=Drosophila guanche TaxID=7266 RepID=A0A3B0KUT3_DROGU|nr:uncharacterized protein LOC117590688 [Drosophila guanche]SPP89091.1 Hypothetical predicted protein [Drosophila guanche]